MKHLKLAAAVLAALTTLAPAQAQTPALGERMGPWGYDLAGRDLTAKPGDDFFKWANGGWDTRTQIPSDHTRYGNFDMLIDLSEKRVYDILLETAAAAKPADADSARIAAAWRSFMDEARVESLDAKPLAPMLDAVRAARTHGDMAALMGRSSASDFKSFFGMAIRDDAKNPQRYTVYLVTDGLGLPDRDYYLQQSFAAKKTAYEAYVAELLAMVQWPDAANAARAIVAMETKIAEATWTRAERRDRDKTYTPKTLDQLQAFAPGLDWRAMLAQAELAVPPKLVLTSDSAFPKIAAIYHDTPLATLQAWQAFHVVDASAPLLSKRFVAARFAFRSVTLAGQPEERPRWKRGVAFVNSALGEAVGKVYVARHFPPQSKATMLGLVGNVRDALRLRVEKLDWMGPQTKVQALDKLGQFTVKIAYPDVWRDYSTLVMKDGDLFGNSQRAQAFEWQRQVARINQPVDRSEWGMTPQTVNAYYNPTKNEIVFPAAILQPPFFDPQADPAINYGGIGGVIGHEVSHGFDDQGRKSDGTGLLRDWWTADDAAKFKAQADRLGKQYDAFEPLPGAHVNGALTMGENIGDLGGLLLGLDAYKLSLQGKPAAVVDGTTGTQRVFLGWAQVWREKAREETARSLLVRDPHSPSYYRVNGVVRNIDAWYDAFGVKPGDKLYLAPEDRVRIW